MNCSQKQLSRDTDYVSTLIRKHLQISLRAYYPEVNTAKKMRVAVATLTPICVNLLLRDCHVEADAFTKTLHLMRKLQWMEQGIRHFVMFPGMDLRSRNRYKIDADQLFVGVRDSNNKRTWRFVNDSNSYECHECPKLNHQVQYDAPPGLFV